MRRPVKIHDWLMCPVASASVRLYVVEVILRGAKMRSVTNYWKVIPEYVLMTSGRKMYICSTIHVSYCSLAQASIRLTKSEYDHCSRSSYPG